MTGRTAAGDRHAPPGPRLYFDGAAAAALLCAFAIRQRTALTPDGVAYLENGELFATGRWTEALQGYWSPGYSLLLSPAAWVAGDNRDTLLLIAHVVQTMLGLLALWLAAKAVQRRVPSHAQRVVFWGCAWIILRWLTQELVTPDLLLCVLLLWYLSLPPAADPYARVLRGVIIAAGFLVKSSIWPWLLVAVMLEALRCSRAHSWRTFPVATALVAVAGAAPLVVTLSVRAGQPTLGSVGTLNTRWYLGDRSRRTPDLDLGPHTSRRLLALRPGVVITAYDLRFSGRTYAPWSDPERWAQGVPASARPRLNLKEASIAWRQNAGELARWLLPLVVGLTLLVAGTVEARGSGIREWLRDRPLLTVGASAALMFAVVHAEHRLLAPAGLMLLLGAWHNPETASPRSIFAWVAAALVILVVAQVSLYLPAAAAQAARKAQYEESFHQHFNELRANGGARDVVVVGPFGLWMGILWRDHLRVAAQIGVRGAVALASVPDDQLRQWLRAAFGTSLLGVASTRSPQPESPGDFSMEFLQF